MLAKKINLLNPLCLAALMASSLGASLHAQVVLYSESFGGGATILDGSTVDVVNSGIQLGANHGNNSTTWMATSLILQNGSLQPNGSASLSFDPQDGYVYTLDIAVDFSDGEGWVGVGFAGANDRENLVDSNSSGGILWALTRPLSADASKLQVAHADVTGGAGPLTATGSLSAADPSIISVRLDTRDGSGGWDVQYLVGGSEFASLTNLSTGFETAIGAVKFSSKSTLGANVIESFQLTVIPEPASLVALMIGGLGALVLLRRWKIARRS